MAGLPEVGNGELADEEVPVWVAGPLDFPGGLEIKGKLNAAGDDFVGDGTVVDAVDRDEVTGGVSVVEFAADGDEMGDVDDGDAEFAGGDEEVREGLLAGWIHFSEDDVFRGVGAEYGTAEELEVGVAVEAAEEGGEGEVEGAGVGVGEGGLESVEGGECLHFDETGLEIAGGSLDEGEIGGEEVGAGVLAGNAKAGRDGLSGLGEIVGGAQEAAGEGCACVGEGLEEGKGEEDGGFRDAERGGNAGGELKIVEECLILAGEDIGVERGAYSRNQGEPPEVLLRFWQRF